MLKSITLENYKTYIKKTKVDFSASQYKFLEKENTKDGILKGALFVGENASGKTTLLQAISLLFELLNGDSSPSFTNLISFYSDKPSFSVDYEFLIQSVPVIYSLEIDRDGITSESLRKDDKVILERRKNQIKYIAFDEERRRTINQEKIASSLPFARKLYFDTRFFDDKILNAWFESIANSVFVDCINQQNAASSTVHEEINYRRYFDKYGTSEVNNILKEIQYDQDLIFATETPKVKNRIRFQSSSKFVSFRKKNTGLYIPEWFESTGNRALMNILPPILHAIKHNSILIINEFSSGLYNDLEKSLIRYFFQKSKKSQLFFTTHSTNILSNSILRPDQEYSIRFDYEKGGSQVNRFSDQSPREAQNIEKMYLNGVFDDVPNYNKNFSA